MKTKIGEIHNDCERGIFSFQVKTSMTSKQSPHQVVIPLSIDK